MNLLVDTHVLLWWLADSDRLPPTARAAISDMKNVCLVSAATIWEIEIKRSIGKLVIPSGYRDALSRQGFQELPVTWLHARAIAALPAIHRDPFDRMLVAQATCEGLTIITADRDIPRYDVRVMD